MSDAKVRLTDIGSVCFGRCSEDLRAWKKPLNGTPTYFLYSGSQPVCELDNLGNIVAVNTFGPAGLASRHTSASGTTFYAWDGRGNPSQTVNSSGTVTNTFSFDGYGKYTSTIAPTDPYSNYGGQWGYYTDPETGLTLCGHRFYDAYTARFLNRDPIGQNGGANVYQYVGGSPLMGADPSGFMSEFCMPGVNDVFDPLSGGGELGSEAESMGMGGDIPCPEGVLEEAGGGAVGGGELTEEEAFEGGVRGPSPAFEAMGQQGRGNYSGVDNWVNVTLPKGLLVAGGVPGPSNFYAPLEAVTAVDYDQVGYWEGLQVAPDDQFGFRPGVTVYEVPQDTQAAASQALANSLLSNGGLPQYYIPDSASILMPRYSIRLNR